MFGSYFSKRPKLGTLDLDLLLEPQAEDAGSSPLNAGLRRLFGINNREGVAASAGQDKDLADRFGDLPSGFPLGAGASQRPERLETTGTGSDPRMDPRLSTRPRVVEEAIAPPPLRRSENEIAYGEPPVTGPSGSRKTMKELMERIDAPADVQASRDKSFWGRMGGAAKMHKDDPKQTGLEGAGYNIGSMIAKMFGAAFDPKSHAEMKKQDAIGRLGARAQQELGVENAAIEQEAEAAKMRKAQVDANMAHNKPWLDAVLMDDEITEEEAAEGRRRGIPLQAGDARQFNLEWVNGKPMSAPKKGVPNYSRNPTLNDRLEDVPVDTTIRTSDGKDVTLPLKPGQAASTIVGVEQANAQRQQRAAEFVAEQEQKQADKEYKSEQEFLDDVRGWEGRQREAKAQESKARAAITKLQETRQELINQGYDGTDQVTGIDKQIATLEGDIAEANELKREPKPKRPAVKKPPAKKGGGSRYSQEDIDRVLRQ